FPKGVGMTQQELVKQIAQELSITLALAEKMVRATCAKIGDGLVKGGQVRLGTFGTFVLKVRKARKSRNPRTGEQLDVPQKVVAAFRPGSDLKERVSKLTDVPGKA